ncbi:hypothetical protein AMTRI_Chr13g88170 [Amborella trichopoda]
MDTVSSYSESSSSPSITPTPDNTHASASSEDSNAKENPSKLSASAISSWARSLRITQPVLGDETQSNNYGKLTFSRFTSGFGLRTSPKAFAADEGSEGTSATTPTMTQSGVFGSITKGLVDSSRNAVKAVQVKARHIVSQNKRRYQEDGFDLDMTYITENVIAMGFPAGDLSSGILGYVEGFYRNHMEEVIKFFETHHKGKYKVYNLCLERLYDASLFEGKVACFPFDDHNCPPIQLIISFCQSAYLWLKEDIENVVVVHCKAGMARTGLMISSLLLYLKFFPTAEESIAYYNQKRCVDGKGLVLPSQIRYVKYFERILTYFNGENQPGRRCMLRGFRLHRCPYWIRPSITVSDHNGVLFSTKRHPRTKDMMPEDFWFSAPRKGIMVFALPGERGLTEVAGDFKIHFHDRQGDFYWYRKLPSPGFQVEVVLMDYDAFILANPKAENNTKESDSNTNIGSGGTTTSSTTTTATPHGDGGEPIPNLSNEEATRMQVKDDIFSDSEAEEIGSSKGRQSRVGRQERGGPAAPAARPSAELPTQKETVANVTNAEGTKQSLVRNEAAVHVSSGEPKMEESVPFEAAKMDSVEGSDFKAMAADASVFTFGDDEDYESE